MDKVKQCGQNFDKMDKIEQNGTKWTNLDKIDKGGQILQKAQNSNRHLQAKIHSLPVYQIATTLHPILWMKLIKKCEHFLKVNFEVNPKIMDVIEFRDDTASNAI